MRTITSRGQQGATKASSLPKAKLEERAGVYSLPWRDRAWVFDKYQPQVDTLLRCSDMLAVRNALRLASRISIPAVARRGCAGAAVPVDDVVNGLTEDQIQVC